MGTLLIVLDSNVLVYAAGGEHPLRDPCRLIFEAVVEGVAEATTTVAMIDEFVSVHGRRRDRPTAARRAEEFLAILSPLLTSEEVDVRPALRLFERIDAIDASDAFLAVAAIRNEAEALVSADHGFANVPRLRYVDPSSDALRSLISRDADSRGPGE
jgi:uncharacterized protein